MNEAESEKKSYYDGKSIFLWHDKKENSLISNVFSMLKIGREKIVTKKAGESENCAKESEHPLFISRNLSSKNELKKSPNSSARQQNLHWDFRLPPKNSFETFLCVSNAYKNALNAHEFIGMVLRTLISNALRII